MCYIYPDILSKARFVILIIKAFKPKHPKYISQIVTFFFFSNLFMSCNRALQNFSKTQWKMFWSHCWGFWHNNERQKCLSGKNKQFQMKLTEIIITLETHTLSSQSHQQRSESQKWTKIPGGHLKIGFSKISTCLY